MTRQENELLRKLKKAQLTEDRGLFVNYDLMRVVTVHDGNQEYVTVDLKDFKGSIHSVMSSLKDRDLLLIDDLGYAKVKHKGWHTTQISIQNVMKFTFRDVIVPIIVSLITVVLTELALYYF